MRCVIIKSEASLCQAQNKDFLECKRKRDSSIFGAIRTWEKDHFGTLKLNQRKEYLDDLEDQLGALNQQKERIPVRAVNENKIWRFNSDIAQLRWRLGYLKKIAN